LYISNGALKLGMSNLVWEWTINVWAHYAFTNMLKAQNLELYQTDLTKTLYLNNSLATKIK